jgi:hypothetical protein
VVVSGVVSWEDGAVAALEVVAVVFELAGGSESICLSSIQKQGRLLYWISSDIPVESRQILSVY